MRPLAIVTLAAAEPVHFSGIYPHLAIPPRGTHTEHFPAGYSAVLRYE